MGPRGLDDLRSILLSERETGRLTAVAPDLFDRGHTELVTLINKVSVRTRMILDLQPPDIQQHIGEFIRLGAETYRENGVIELAWPALLTVVQKPN